VQLAVAPDCENWPLVPHVDAASAEPAGKAANTIAAAANADTAILRACPVLTILAIPFVPHALQTAKHSHP
jgi:hypothetical protein